MQVDQDKYDSWTQGEGLIQDIFPELTDGDRELLISATCDECWEKLFPGGEGDDS